MKLKCFKNGLKLEKKLTLTCRICSMCAMDVVEEPCGTVDGDGADKT
jgi:hypothetical protein